MIYGALLKDGLLDEAKELELAVSPYFKKGELYDLLAGRAAITKTTTELMAKGSPLDGLKYIRELQLKAG